MPRDLVIVESPAKAKTIAHYLGEGYTVKASVGHVRDLPEKGLAVDIEHGFAPTYEVSQGRKTVLEDITRAARGSQHIYLATDPDREGEAIAWHVSEAAGLDPTVTRRIVFHQVTRAAVREALEHPRDLDRHLIDAQQARRVLDRIVGYTISPLLSRSMRKRALSAGRVQSVALRLVVDREREILSFVPQEYWSLDAYLRRTAGAREEFRARLVEIAGDRPGLATKEEVDRHLARLANASYVVEAVRPGRRQRHPNPPFVTSTLQASASARLGMAPRQTMRVAQALYEGLDLAGERVGLITYMRTDATHVAPEAQTEARAFVAKRWGQEYLPANAPIYRTRVANAQEAHEAIRPTAVERTPDALRPYLDKDQARLYELIWQRFVASQMSPAIYDTLQVDIIAANDYLFRAAGQTLVFPGFLAAYAEEEEEEVVRDSQTLPPLSPGQVLDLIRLAPEQRFTEPPPRYSEATLIRALEANGVGRPSTYASIVGVIQERGYVLKERGRLRPTALGMIVCDVLLATFRDIMDAGYTAEMESRLDGIARGEIGYVPMLSSFYGPFATEAAEARKALPGVVKQALDAGLAPELLARACPVCGKPLEVRLSARGRFLGCIDYPACRYSLDLEHPEAQAVAEYADHVCPLCGGRLRKVTSGRSPFWGCENYPRCKHTESILSEEIQSLAREATCPNAACGHSPLEAASGRYGEYLRCPACKTNYSLSRLGLRPAGHTARSRGQAEARGATAETVDIACPHCGHRPVERRSGRFGPYYRCPQCKKNTSERKMAATPSG